MLVLSQVVLEHGQLLVEGLRIGARIIALLAAEAQRWLVRHLGSCPAGGGIRLPLHLIAGHAEHLRRIHQVLSLKLGKLGLYLLLGCLTGIGYQFLQLIIDLREWILLGEGTCNQIILDEAEQAAQYKEIFTCSCTQNLMQPIELHQ